MDYRTMKRIQRNLLIAATLMLLAFAGMMLYIWIQVVEALASV